MARFELRGSKRAGYHLTIDGVDVSTDVTQDGVTLRFDNGQLLAQVEYRVTEIDVDADAEIVDPAKAEG